MKSSQSHFGRFNRSLFSGLHLTAIAALLFTFSLRDASAQNVWLGHTSDYNTASNWSFNSVPEGGWGNNAYFTTPNSTITFSQPNNDPASIFFTGNSAGDVLGAPGGTNGFNFDSNPSGIYVESALQGSNGTITINAPIQINNNTFYLNNYTPEAGGNSLASVQGQAGSGTGNVFDVNSTITGSGTVNFYGIGDVNVAGNLQSTGTIYVNTTGKVTLSGTNNTFSGGIQVGGTLVIDNVTNNANKIAASSYVLLGNSNNGGHLIVNGNNAGTTLDLSTLYVRNGADSITVNSGTTGTTTVNLPTYNYGTGVGGTAALNITLNNNGAGTAVLTTTSTNLNWYGAQFDILSGSTTINQGGQTYFAQAGTNYVFDGSQSQAPIAITAQTVDWGDTFAALNQEYTVNESVPGGAITPGTQTLTADGGANTIRFGIANALDLGGHTVSLGLGGILVSEGVSGNTSISNGTLYDNGPWGGMSFMNYGTGVLTVSADINNAGGDQLSKFGSGLVILSGDNSNLTNGYFEVASGTLQLGSATALGSNEGVSMGDSTSVLDLHGYNANIQYLNSNQVLGLSGGQAAGLGYNTNVANLAAGTVSSINISGNAGTGVFTPYGPSYGYSYNYGLGSYYGGWQEASGAVLGLSLAHGTAPPVNFIYNTLGQVDNVYSGIHTDPNANISASTAGAPIFYLSMGTILDTTGGNGVDASGINGTSNVISGAVGIGANTILGFGGYGNFETTGVTTLDGSMAELAQQGNGYSTTYLAGAYGLSTYTITTVDNTDTSTASTVVSVTSNTQTNILSSNSNFALTVNGQGSTVDEYAGTLGTATTHASVGLAVGGTGTLKLDNGVNDDYNQTFDTSKLILPDIMNGANLQITALSSVTMTSTGTSGSVLGNVQINNGTLNIAPTFESSGANVVLSANNLQYTGGASLFLDNGGNNSLTFQINANALDNTFGNAEENQYGSFLSIGTAQGLSALGTSDIILVAGTPQITGGILSPSIVGVDYTNNQAATFLTYSTGGTGPQGIIAYTSPTTDINAATINNVVDVGTSHETLTSSVTAYAIEVDKGGSITTGNNGIQIGNYNGGGEAGIILNGGLIDGYVDVTQPTHIYTSLDNGTISNLRTVIFGNPVLEKGGAGTLYLPTLTDGTGAPQIVISQGALDTNLNLIPFGGDVFLNGGVLQGSGTLNRNLGGAYGGGQLEWIGPADAGGFSARGGSLSVTLNGGSQLVWGSTGGFLGQGGVLMFGSNTTDNVVTLTNNLNLGQIAGAFTEGGGLYSRVIEVTGNSADAGIDPLKVSDYAVLSGVISQSNSYQGLSKDGNGVLYLTGDNTYTGATTIANGALVIGSDANLGTAPTALYAYNTTPTVDGVVVTGGALTPGAILIDSGATLVTTGSFELSGNRTILLGSGSGGLANASNIEVSGGGDTVTFNGHIGEYVNEVGVLNKEGDGTLALGGDNYYTGATIISGGTINLSGTLNNGNAWNGSGGAGPLGGVGTDLVFQGKGGGFIYDYSNAGQSDVGRQNMGELALNGGGATVENDSETQANTLAFTSLSNGMGNGTTVNFIIPNLGGITFGSGVTNDAVMGPNAYFDGYDFAYYDGTVGVKATDFSGGAPGTVIVAGQFDSSVPYVLAAGGFDQGQNAAITGLLILDGVGITQNQTVSTGTTLTVQSILESTYAGNASPGTATIGGGFLTTGNGTPLFIRTDAVGDILDVGDEILSSSTGGLTKSGDGTLILSNSAMGANAYTGGTVITGGTLELGDGSTPDDTHDGNLGAGAVVNYGALVVNNYGDTVIGNDISGDGTLLLTGGGTGAATVELTGNNSYSGATEVENGTLQIGTSGSLSAQTDVVLGNGTNSGVLVLGDGTGGAISATLANLGTSGTGTGNAVVGGNGSISNLTVANNADDTFGGTIGGTGTNQNNLGLTKSGSGRLTLTGNNSFTGGTVITNGTISLGSATALGSTSSIAFDGGALQYSAANTTDYSSIIQNSTSDIQIDTNGQNVTFASTLAASNLGGIDKTGAGTLSLLQNSAYTGNLSVTDGTLEVYNSNVGSSVYIANGATVDLLATTNTGYQFNMGPGGGIINGKGDDLLYGSITGTSVTFGSFNPAAPADFLFIGNGDVGTINIVNSRVLMLYGNTNLLNNNATVNIENDGNLDFGTENVTVNNTINVASGGALETRGGNITFTNVNLATAGTVTLGADDVGGGSITLTGQALNLTGDLTLVIGAGTEPGNSAANPNFTPVTLSMNIGGTGGLIVNSGLDIFGTSPVTSNLTINGTNSYSGQTTVNSGGLVVISGNNSGAGTVDHSVNVENGTLQIATGGSISSASNLTLGNGTTSGVFVLGDATNSNNVTVASLNSAGTGTGNAVVNGGSGSTSTFTVNGGGTYGGAIGGGGSNQNNVALVKSNEGTLDLTGNTNTYTGGTTVNGGTLLVNNTNSVSSGTGSGAVQVNTGSVLGGSGFIAGGGITIASGAQLAPGLDPLGVASGVMTLTSVGEAPVLTLETPASPSTPAQLSFMLGAGVNPATEVGAGTVLSGGVTLVGSSTYIKLAVDAAGEVVFSTDTSLPTLASIDLLNHDSTGLGNYLLFAGGADSDYANLIVNGVLNDDANGFSNGLITGGLDLFPINDQSGQLFLENGNIYVDMETVPEPGTWAMLVMGLALLGGACYRRARRAAALLAAQ